MASIVPKVPPFLNCRMARKGSRIISQNERLEIYQNLALKPHNKKRQQLDTRRGGPRMTPKPSAVFDLEMGNFEPQNKKRVSIYLSGIVFFGSD